MAIVVESALMSDYANFVKDVGGGKWTADPKETPELDGDDGLAIACRIKNRRESCADCKLTREKPGKLCQPCSWECSRDQWSCLPNFRLFTDDMGKTLNTLVSNWINDETVSRYLMALVNRALVNKDDDVRQKSQIKLMPHVLTLRDLQQSDGDGAARGYLRQVWGNTDVDNIRNKTSRIRVHEKFRQQMENSASKPAENYSSLYTDDVADDVRELLHDTKLNEIEQKTIRMYYWERLSIRAIAKQLDMTCDAVYRRKRNAVKKLRAAARRRGWL